MSAPIETTPADDPTMIDLVTHPSVVAVVGLSPKPDRPSYGVARFLIDQGFTVYGVNPAAAGQTILGRPVVATLADVPEHIHIVDVFRQSDAVPQVVEDAIAVGADAIWLQLDIWNPEAVARAREAGLKMVVNRCMMVEGRRLARHA
jgi:predicted CoA-binding protein